MDSNLKNLEECLAGCERLGRFLLTAAQRQMRVDFATDTARAWPNPDAPTILRFLFLGVRPTVFVETVERGVLLAAMAEFDRLKIAVHMALRNSCTDPQNPDRAEFVAAAADLRDAAATALAQDAVNRAASSGAADSK